MNKLLMILFILSTLVSCASISKTPTQVAKIEKRESVEDILDQAQANATLGGRKILEASRLMIANQEIIVGGCWNYINSVYDRAGYSLNQRITVFKSKLKGPYLDEPQISPGDWLYFVNHAHRDIEHSAVFIAWTDIDKKEALMVSYVGGNKKQPGLYKKFTLDNIYNVIRTQD